MCDGPDLHATIGVRAADISNLSLLEWDRLAHLRASGEFDTEFDAGFKNGRAFREAPDALNGRHPRISSGPGVASPGDEVVPADLRIDHVYMVSCKYLSKISAQSSPARLVEGLLSQASIDDLRRLGTDESHQRSTRIYTTPAYEGVIVALPTRVIDLLPAHRER